MQAGVVGTAGQSSEIDRYEVPREVCLPGFGTGMTIDDFQISGIRHGLTKSLKIKLGPIQAPLGEIY